MAKKKSIFSLFSKSFWRLGSAVWFFVALVILLTAVDFSNSENFRIEPVKASSFGYEIDTEKLLKDAAGICTGTWQKSDLSDYFQPAVVLATPKPQVCLAKVEEVSRDVEISNGAAVESAEQESNKARAGVEPLVVKVRVERVTEPVEVESVATVAPTPQAVQTVEIVAANTAQSELDALFEKYGAEYGVDPNVLRSIAYCESTNNPAAVNGPYAGLFQFVTSTWVANRNAMGLDPDPALRFDAEEAIRTAAYKISRDGTGAWPVCQYR